MKIEFFPAPTVPKTLQEFADLHGLTMECHERRAGDWFAHFKDAAIVDGPFDVGAYGNGDDTHSAMSAYAKRIAGQTLRVGPRTYFVPDGIYYDTTAPCTN